MSNNLDFYALDMEAVYKRDKANDDFLSLKDGDNIIRIMPPWAAGKLYDVEYKVHYNLKELINYGLETEWFSEVCLSSTEGKCPLCVLSVKAQQAGAENGNPALVDLGNKLRAKTQHMANVVDMEEIKNGVKVLRYGIKMKRKFISIFSRKKDITHPINGYNLIVSKDSSGEYSDYGVSIDDKVDISEHWATFKPQLKDLEALIRYSKLEDVTEKCLQVEFTAIKPARNHSIPTVESLSAESAESVTDEDVDNILNEIENN